MKLRVLIFCAICCAWLAGPKLWGQTAAVALPDAADARTASLVGHVVTEPGAEPIKKAIIELVQEGGDSTHNYTATSAPDGSFDISGIEPGRYRILVEKTGFVFVDAKHRSKEASAITLLRGQALPDQTLRMWPTAVLTGRVLDEDG